MKKKHDSTENDKILISDKIQLLFRKPSELFKYYNNKSWKLPFTAAGLIAVIFAFLQYYLLDSEKVNDIVNTEINPEVASAINMSKTLEEAILLSVVMILAVYLTILVSSIVYYVLVSVHGGKVKFSQMAAVYATAVIITLIGDVVILLLKIITGNKLALNLNPYLNILFNQLNPFNIWSIIITYIGIRTVSGLSKKKTITIIVIMIIGTIIYKVGGVSLSQAIQG